MEQEMEVKKGKRGGYRAGAGRPKSELTESLNIRVSPEAMKLLVLKAGNRRQFIDGLVRYFARYVDDKGCMLPEYEVRRRNC